MEKGKKKEINRNTKEMYECRKEGRKKGKGSKERVKYGCGESIITFLEFYL